jgi:hypothetical protein
MVTVELERAPARRTLRVGDQRRRAVHHHHRLHDRETTSVYVQAAHDSPHISERRIPVAESSSQQADRRCSSVAARNARVYSGHHTFISRRGTGGWSA